MSPTDETPGIAASLSRIRCSVWTTATASFTADSGMKMRMSARAPARLNPGGTCFNAWNVRIINPELTSSTSASAIWTTTRVLLARFLSLL